MSPQMCNHIWKISQHRDMSWIKSQLETILCIWLTDWNMKTYRRGHNKTLNTETLRWISGTVSCLPLQSSFFENEKVLLVDNVHYLHICNLVDLYTILCAFQNKFWNKAGVFMKLITLDINTAILQLNRWFNSNLLLLNLEKNLLPSILNQKY